MVFNRSSGKLPLFRLPDSGGPTRTVITAAGDRTDFKKRLGQTEQHGLDDQGQGGKMYRNAARILSIDASSTD